MDDLVKKAFIGNGIGNLEILKLPKKIKIFF